jgi:hypothetical protein
VVLFFSLLPVVVTHGKKSAVTTTTSEELGYCLAAQLASSQNGAFSFSKAHNGIIIGK